MHNGYVHISYVRTYVLVYVYSILHMCMYTYIHTYKYLLYYSYVAAVAMLYVRLCQLCN